jgi:hypothetical protein
MRTSMILVLAAATTACVGQKDTDPSVTDADADADADTDTDTDTDTDVDLSCADEDGGNLVPAEWTGDTLGAGDDFSSYCEYAGPGDDYGFSFVAPDDGDYVFQTSDAGFGNIVSVYDGCGGYELDCQFNYNTASRVTLTAGQGVVVVVHSFYPGNDGTFTLSVDRVAANETDCADGVDEDFDYLTDCIDPDCAAEPNCAPVCPDDQAGTFPDTLVGTTVAAPSESDGGCDFSAFYGIESPDTSIEFTAPDAGTYGFALEVQGTTFDSVLYLLDDCGGTELDCADWILNGGETVTADLTAGQTVLVVVDGFNGQAGDFTLRVFAPNVVEDCGDGIDDDADGLPDCFDEDCAFDVACYEDCGNGVDDDGDLAPDCFDSACALDPSCYEDCENGLDDDGDNAIDCADLGCAGEPACASICPEDTLAGALPLQAVGTTLGRNDDNDGCIDNPGTSDYTWEFTAPADGDYVFTTVDTPPDGGGAQIDTALAVLDGCGGAELECNDDIDFAGGDIESEILMTMTAGQTVIIVADTYDALAPAPFVVLTVHQL